MLDNDIPLTYQSMYLRTNVSTNIWQYAHVHAVGSRCTEVGLGPEEADSFAANDDLTCRYLTLKIVHVNKQL